MGTSQSSGGPGGGVPMVPSWTPDPPAGGSPESESGGGKAPDEPAAPAPEAPPRAPVPAPLAPPARFLGARRALGDYARSGDSRELRRGLGHYVRTGYGGSATATRRFGGTATTAGALGGALASVAAGQPAAPGSPLDPVLLAGRTAQEVMDAVVEVVRPVDGTQDAEAERASIRDALSELLTRFPDADLLNLDPDQRAFAIERFTAIDVFRRFELDLGKTIIEKAPSAATALARLREARDFIKQSVAASFRKLRGAGRTLTSGRIGQVVGDALKETFEIFEGYAE
ncbi:Qat anti-phage system associated protein QatB [Rhodoligotrophos defluvii]|uniref:Qat anti-phage system associated protein QatB n=1 Tax=Rhodoligotrophos defluvii TaxID=2561934 RepID=UPI0010C9A0CB